MMRTNKEVFIFLHKDLIPLLYKHFRFRCDDETMCNIHDTIHAFPSLVDESGISEEVLESIYLDVKEHGAFFPEDFK